MINKEQFNDLITYALIIGLFILAAIIIKPVIMTILFGILLAYILYPVYRIILKKLKNENLSALIVCLIVLISIILITGLILTSLFKQAIDFYFNLQEIDFVGIVNQIPTISSYEISSTVVSSLNTYASTFIAKSISGFRDIILNLPMMLLKLFVAIFIFFFSLRDGRKALDYIKSLTPLKKETFEKFSKQFKDVTNSVLVGQIVVGVLQGIISGIGYFIFGVPNALLLTLLTMLIGVIPLIGPWLIWIPIDLYLFATGRYTAGIGFFVYGMILINLIDTVIRPLIVAKKTRISSGIIIIGMIGGLLAFGVLGLIIGPLVLAYVLLVIEMYRQRPTRNGNVLFIKK